MKVAKALYINSLFFYSLLGIVALFIVSFFFGWLFVVAELCLVALLTATLIDSVILFMKNGITGERIAADRLSNGDQNEILIKLRSNYSFTTRIEVVDEIPMQFQIRDFSVIRTIKSGESDQFVYFLRPVERGEYQFGALNCYVSSAIGLVAKRYRFDSDKIVPVYPSYIQLRKYGLVAFNDKFKHFGLRKIRRIGHTTEFEQIKEYVRGDDIRTINWKATAKRNELMVNQYQDEKAQEIYLVIDKGRQMKMPFNGMTLLDYAINSTLVLANVIINKSDKAGMFTFSRKVENIIAADRRKTQMQLITENLYSIQTDFKESDFSRLYVDVKRTVRQRSLLMLFTNFDTIESMKRQLPYLKGMARSHLLVIVFFRNTELDHIMERKSSDLFEVFEKVTAEKYEFEKRLIVNELRKHGIYSVLTEPENLTMETINKYLEIKARGLL